MQESQPAADGATEVQSEDDSEPGGDWAAKCVESARAAHPVPEAVSAALTTQLESVAGERALRSSELAALAQKFLTALSPAPEKDSVA